MTKKMGKYNITNIMYCITHITHLYLTLVNDYNVLTSLVER